MSDAEIFQARKMFPALTPPKAAFRNHPDLRFEEVGREWGFDQTGVTQGMCLADLDGDGDLDVIVNNLNGAAGVYRNESGAPRVAVRLKGRAPNTRGIGAKISFHGGAVPIQSQEMICAGRYLSSDDSMRVFAAESQTNAMRIEVQWRSGKRSIVNGVKANRIYEIEEAGAQSVGAEPKTEPKPAFEDVSQLIHHTHHEEAYDDFGRQPLLPRKLSQLGPGVAWFDLDGDGWEDLIVGSGRGGRLAVYRNNGRGGFEELNGAPFDKTATRDQTAVLGVGSGLLVGSANYEDGLSVGSCVRRYNLVSKSVEDAFPGQEWTTGPLALGDVNGGGRLELFVGGRVLPGKYPEPAASLLYRQVQGNWELDAENSKALTSVGMVSGAVWGELDEDGYPELILACEWGPVRVFHNEKGKLREVTKELGLAQYTGWWNGVNVGDFDGDGRMDIVASNWGLNTKYRASREHPLKIYYGNLDGRERVDIVEAYYDEKMKMEVPGRDLDAIASAVPWIREKYATYESYGRAGIEEIYADKRQKMKHLEATTLSTMIFLNRSDHFEARSLPQEAQLSPAFAVCVGDYDGDGHEDVFLSQNFFAVSPDQSRCDAGRGLWLKGDGTGILVAVPGQESGIKVYGEQRGAALCDYDEDGRIDLVVTQNGAETKLFHNVRAKRGLRIRLNGPPGNPNGMGAQLRLKFGERLGPVRQIVAGGGYWSQDSAVQVMAIPEAPTQIWVRWPGGEVTRSPLPQGAQEIHVRPDGTIERHR
jgi:hypothetical protein